MNLSTLRIATRKSALALWQAQYVADALHNIFPALNIELIPLITQGDQILDRSLAEVGGKGLFLKELEIAMLEGRADIAVHSLKDVPTELEADFTLPAILPRADASDALISNHYTHLAELPPGARVGTTSLRRQVQLLALRPDLQLMDLRGNIGTRLHKLDAGDYDAIVLACAGLDRLGLSQRITQRLSAPAWLPAPGQGAIAVEAPSHHQPVLELLAKLDHAETRMTVSAERVMSHALGGNCSVPVGAWSLISAGYLHLYGLVGDASNGHLVRAYATETIEHSATLGQRVADELLANGGQSFL